MLNCSSCVQTGETLIEAAEREVYEECGIKLLNEGEGEQSEKSMQRHGRVRSLALPRSPTPFLAMDSIHRDSEEQDQQGEGSSENVRFHFVRQLSLASGFIAY